MPPVRMQTQPYFQLQCNIYQAHLPNISDDGGQHLHGVHGGQHEVPELLQAETPGGLFCLQLRQHRLWREEWLLLVGLRLELLKQVITGASKNITSL